MGVGKTTGPELKSRMALRLSTIFLDILSGLQSYMPPPPFLTEWIIFIFAAVWIGRYY